MMRGMNGSIIARCDFERSAATDRRSRVPRCAQSRQAKPICVARLNRIEDRCRACWKRNHAQALSAAFIEEAKRM
jgi:hypothetical protein